MKVFKFGGASVKDAAAVKNVAQVVRLFPSDKIAIVVSAMGKTTNAMEQLVESWYKGTSETRVLWQEILSFHQNIVSDLFANTNLKEIAGIEEIISETEERLSEEPSEHFDYEYDQLVSVGELISTLIVSHYLKTVDSAVKWFDARKIIRTDSTYREARIDWEPTQKLIEFNVKTFFNSGGKLAIVPGFIGSTDTKQTTTLGREGSDFSAAILAYCLQAESVIIWKDVPGMLNADPKYFDNTVRLPKISFKEAIELSYYGATIIHPKTLKPLQNKNIPLYVKSFIEPLAEGTVIQATTENDHEIPSFIFRMNQVLISISPRDFSFIMEESLSHIFNLFHHFGVKINLMQNSAISFSVSVDDDKRKVEPLIDMLNKDYAVKYNRGLELVTIRHYNDETIKRVTLNKEILVEQKSRYTVRMVMRDLGN
ncbi:MAG: aspartate kinase [Flavobacteriales bacterium]